MNEAVVPAIIQVPKITAIHQVSATITATPFVSASIHSNIKIEKLLLPPLQQCAKLNVAFPDIPLLYIEIVQLYVHLRSWLEAAFFCTLYYGNDGRKFKFYVKLTD